MYSHEEDIDSAIDVFKQAIEHYQSEQVRVLKICRELTPERFFLCWVDTSFVLLCVLNALVTLSCLKKKQKKSQVITFVFPL